MFPLSGNVKLFIVLGVLALAHGLYTKVVLDERSRMISELTDKVENQAQRITVQNKQIKELDDLRLVEAGLRKIIEFQNDRFFKLSGEYETLKKKSREEIESMSDKDRDMGLEIYTIWKLYNGGVE